MIPAALHEPPTRKTFQTVKCICDEVARNAADFGTAWPIFAHYFDAARIPTYDYSTPASVFRANCVEQCIVAVSFPSKEEPNMPRLFEREDYRALLASRALDIFAWAKHMAQPFLVNPDRVTWHAYQALSRVFDLLQDIRFCVPDAVDTILAFWKAELRSQQLFDMSHATMFSPTSWAMLELLGRIGNPGPQHYPQLPPLRERFMGNMNTIVATAFARVDRLNHSLEAAKSDALRTLGPSILETLTRVAGFLDLTCLVCPRAIRIVTAEYRHFVARPIETSGIFAAPDFEKIAQSASRMAAVAAVDYLKFALSTRPVTIALQPAIREGFLDALWCSSKRLNEQTEVGAQLSTRTDIPLPVLRFFIEEVILAHMWDRSVFVSILHWAQNNQALMELEVDQRVQDRLLEWAMLAPERDEIASLDHCDYSKCARLRQGIPSKRCAGCKEALYCSSSCQKAAWKITGDDHRLTCLPRTRRLHHEEPIRTAHSRHFLKGVLQYELAKVFESEKNIADDLFTRVDKLPGGQAYLVALVEAENVHWDVDLLAACPTRDRQELWSDVFAELASSTNSLILVRIQAVSPSMKRPAMAYCCIPRPGWMSTMFIE